MKNIIISVLLFTTLSLSFAKAEEKSDNFSEEQFNQIEKLKQQALKSALAWDLVESLTTEVGPRMPGIDGDKAGVEWAVKKLIIFQKLYQG